MKVHLVDGTYELFRSHFGAPPATSPDGREVGAVRGLMRTLNALVTQEGATHVAVAFDHVIESFRNELFPGYKTRAGVPEELLAQFELAEEACRALGIVAWPMVEFEADDALATAAHRLAEEPAVEQVVICTPDKDLGQCVRGTKVVQLDRRKGIVYGEAEVREKFGVDPLSIPDYLALVGDAADGIPGIPGFGPRSSATILAKWKHIEDIPDPVADWDVNLRGAPTLAATLRERRGDALLYKELATLRLDVPIETSPAALEWKGAVEAALRPLCERIGERNLPGRIQRWV